MAEFNINDQHAEKIYQADIIADVINADTINLAPPPEDHVRAGINALAQGDYGTARAHFGQAVTSSPADPDSHYRLALALLDGRRPHMSSAATMRDIERHLTLAGPLPEARTLLILANEDYYLTWQRNNSVPPELVDLVLSVPLARVREIIQHVPAEECRVWRLLAARIERGF